jgi:hypothetical protein
LKPLRLKLIVCELFENCLQLLKIVWKLFATKINCLKMKPFPGIFSLFSIVTFKNSWVVFLQCRFSASTSCLRKISFRRILHYEIWRKADFPD